MSSECSESGFTTLVFDDVVFQMHTRMHDFSVNSITRLLRAVISNATIVSLFRRSVGSLCLCIVDQQL